jgi:hypothetical protein
MTQHGQAIWPLQHDDRPQEQPVPAPKDRLIPCHDLAGRRGQLVVLSDHGRVVLVTAAGETPVLTPQQVGQLRAAQELATRMPALPAVVTLYVPALPAAPPVEDSPYRLIATDLRAAIRCGALSPN